MTEDQLNKIKGLMHYLNAGFLDASVVVDVKLSDVEGNVLGSLELNNDDDTEYEFKVEP